MKRFFRRVAFAFKAFFLILLRNRLPADVAAEYGAGTPPPVRTADAVESASEGTATEMLAVLQRDGRLVDFLLEDITPYADAQIGAAVRTVHAGCRQALERYVSLAPAVDKEEGARVTVDTGADAARIKVMGNLTGQPPFTGVLRHRGWVVTRMELPAVPATGRSIVAAAEVEVV